MRPRVIVPLDGSAHAHDAIPYGAWLAERHGAELVLLHVSEGPRPSETVEADLAAARASAPFPAESMVRHGSDVTAEIADEAAQVPGSLVCYSTRVGHRLTEMVRTGFSTSLFGVATCPLLLVGPSCKPHPERVKAVMACLDGSALSERVLPVVDDLAEAMALDVWLAQIVDPGALPALATSPSDVAESGYLARLARRLRRPVTSWDVIHDVDPVAAILDHCRAYEGTMPAIATHGRAGAQLVLRGSVALRVAYDCTEPVLVVPPGWERRPD